jgi:hypothetical protein
MADYSRPKEGFRYSHGGVKLTDVPDAIPPGKYAALVNVRAVTDNSLRTRPGMAQLFTTNGANITDLRAYSTLNSDNKPRFLTRNANDTLWLDSGAQVGSMLGGGASLGAAMIPFRPDESPTPYMYVATGTDYQKFSAPSASNVVAQQNAGIAEPQTAPGVGISDFNDAYMGEPAGGAYTVGGEASGLSLGERLNDVVEAVFPDPTGLGITTVQVGGGGSLPSDVYLSGNVLIYLWPRLSYEQGAFGRYYPTATSGASATASGSSVMFNPPQLGDGTDPNVQPMEWAQVSPAGVITGYIPVPTAGGTVGYQDYDMVVLASLFVPKAGNYTININHDDGIVFAIQGATLVSGPFADPFFNHTQTAVNGYAFAPGSSSVLGGTNESGYRTETFVVNFPATGNYALEIDYSQWVSNQALVMLNNGAIFKQATGIAGYQRGMALLFGPNLATVEDVFAPLPQSLSIAGITYLSGTTGQCVVVPNSLGSGPGVDDASIYEQTLLASLRRGALVQIGSEVCYVLDVETGPNGTVCFTTSTQLNHTSSEMLSGVPAISVFFPAAAAGTIITSPDVLFSVTPSGDNTVGTVTFPQNVNAFTDAQAQPQDYLHLSLNIDNLDNLTEAKILFDVGDGSFTENFYYYAIRPNDIALGVSNGLTQLGVAQLVAQRAAIDEEKSAETNNQGPTFTSGQSATGTSQWGEIEFAITELTRVGNDDTKTLQNMNAVQILINANAAVNIAFNSVYVKGGFSPDVGASGAPYLYRVRPRSSLTGVKGNPSPATRYGVNPRRQQVTVQCPSATYDPQIDTWDIFRYGGTVTSWRYIGQVPSAGNALFLDNYSDDSANAGESLDFDNYQPWPSIDIPLNVTASVVTGTLALVNIPGATNILRYLPGNEVKIGGTNVYTLQTRPTLLSGTTYLLRFVENAGYSPNSTLSIYEPALAQQRLPYMWGPDADGTFFATGDPLRSGFFSTSKTNNPDSAPDTYAQELSTPSEPLMGGEIMDGVSYIASTERWWRLYPQLQNEAQRYNPVQQAIPRGLAAPYGKCTDGATVSWWAKDGIWDSKDGSLTDADLYPLFPHDGVAGQAVTYGPVTYQPPDYSRAGTFRLETANGFLYATYTDSGGVYHTLVYDQKRKAWSLDAYANPASVAYHVEQQEGTLLSNTALYPSLVYGLTDGVVASQQDSHNDLASPIPVIIATNEWPGGDVRAGMQWGDLWLDSTPASQITATPMAFGAQASPPVVVGPQSSRLQTPISLGGELLSDFLGLITTWTDDFTSITSPTKVHIWQPSLIPKPETIDDRFTDWYSAGDDDAAQPAAWWQGFVLHADTFNKVKGLQVRDADSGAIHPFTPVVQHNGEQTKAYSFNTPFIAHLVRIEPTDQLPWRMFDMVWVSQPTPEAAETWQTQGTSFGFNGYSHIQRIVGAYAATQPVTVTITSFDGQSPAAITLPSTGGAYEKILQVLTANKGQLYFFKATSAAPFQLYLDDWEILVGNWGRQGNYLTYKSLGGKVGAEAHI